MVERRQSSPKTIQIHSRNYENESSYQNIVNQLKFRLYCRLRRTEPVSVADMT